MGIHCTTCQCGVDPSVDHYGVPLSSDHTICPGCKNAIGKKFLARCGGLCTGCQRKAHPFEDYRTRAHADKRKQPMKLLLQQEE